MPEEKYILVVDDEPILLEFLDLYLSEEGYKVERASNGLEAITMIETRHYHAIVTDVKMPVMDGISFYKRLVDNSPHLAKRVIFISGYLSGDHESFVRSTGCALLFKPFQIRELSRTIASLPIEAPKTHTREQVASI